MSIGISGIQQAQRHMNLMMAAMKPDGKFAKAIWSITMSLHRYAVAVTHVVTGSLRASHRQKMANAFTGLIWITPYSVNPKTHQKPSVYGALEEARGGEHAFYARTANIGAPPIVQKATKGLF